MKKLTRTTITIETIEESVVNKILEFINGLDNSEKKELTLTYTSKQIFFEETEKKLLTD